MKPSKLNFLLVAPRVVKTTGDGYAFPLGLAYISAMLKSRGYLVFTTNLNHIDGEQKEILRQLIETYQINVLGTGGLSFQYSTLFDILQSVKEIKPDIITIVGGGIITAEPDVALKALTYADYGVVGEGEYTICDLADALENNKDIAQIQGIIYKCKNQLIQTHKRKEIADLDELPWPDYDGFDLNHYLELPSVSINNMITKRMAYMAASRSCPYACSFCFHSTGKKYRLRSMEKVFAEMEYLKNKYAIGFVYMVDELFARDKTRLFAFAARMTELSIPWTASFRVDDITEELVHGLKGSTCAGMMFGLESADNRILKSMRKRITVEQIDKALKLAFDAGIPTAGNFIFGDIEETVETAQNTLNWWESHIEYNIGLNLINTYPGTHIYKYACQNKIIKDRVQFLKNGCPQVNISKLSESEMAHIAQQVFSAPYKLGKGVSEVVVNQLHPTGHIDFSGKCAGCGKLHHWQGIKLFVGNSWVPCSYCGQKHNVPLPKEVGKNIERNILSLLKYDKKLGIWGLTYYSIDLIENYDIFHDDRVVLIDNSIAKQQININGKKINPPDILRESNIHTIILFYPNSIQQITSIIQKNYQNVTKTIDVCTLIC